MVGGLKVESDDTRDQACRWLFGTMIFAIRIRGIVQGVGFRPAIWRVARDLNVAGEVLNDAEGVLIRIAAPEIGVDAFIDRLKADSPALARIDAIEVERLDQEIRFTEFSIGPSARGAVRTLIGPDVATCRLCLADVLAKTDRRYRYPFTNCTNCGPRFSIIERVPYDRANTSMACFDICAACRAEYEDPGQRRFHAEPIACPACGPRVRVIDARGQQAEEPGDKSVEAVVRLIAEGGIVAIKGVGGYHLACDATNAGTVEELRRRKQRYGKPFALMVRDVRVLRRYAHVDALEEDALASDAAPIVLLDAGGIERLPEAIAPGLSQLGFMLPYTPLHHLVMRAFDQPLVMSSGNRSEEPQCIDDGDAVRRLSSIADHLLVHDRRIVTRVDDSVVHVVAGAPRVLRRARGYAPASIKLPDGFERAPDILAVGGELKSTFCLIKDGQALLSPHLGDLENEVAWRGFEHALTLMSGLNEHDPAAVAVDLHPEYLASKHGRALAAARQLPLIEVQHHHAHVAACMAENGLALDGGPVLGIVLDGLGFGEDGTIWGGEFLLADYRRYERLGYFKPVAMPGGAQAVRQPWRNLYAHLEAAMGIDVFRAEFANTTLAAYLSRKPTATLAAMIGKGLNAPLASSCGRLFDAVAAALGLCADASRYEGEAAMQLEAALGRPTDEVSPDGVPYDFAIAEGPGAAGLDPAPMWWRLCRDLRSGVPAEIIARRFHCGLSAGVVSMAERVARNRHGGGAGGRVALSGGCFQNRTLVEEVSRGLQEAGFVVLLHAKVPTNDGGLSLGQAAIAAARLTPP
jgi:hydrogenase maturation protein HypF